MKIKLCAIFVLFALNSVLFAQQNKLVWYTSLPEASEVSMKTHKPVFAFFTGSDWCGWCMKLQANVFSKEAFINWAQKNVVLLELDFPRRKQLEPTLAKQNSDLQQTFQVQGFPTVWIFNTEKDTKANSLKIAALGSLGYPAGAEPGKEEVKFISTANGIMGLK